jgi:hypothetical protein
MGGNIKMELKEIGYECVDWIHLAQDRNWALVYTAREIRVPEKAENSLTS